MSLSVHLELADFVWSTELAHEKKFFLTTAKCLFPGGGAQIMLYCSRTAYWPLIKGSLKAHWLMTLCGPNKMIYTDVFWATKVQPLHFFFFSKMATDFSPHPSPLGGRFCLRDTTTKEFQYTSHCRCRPSEKDILHLKFEIEMKA